MLTVRPATLLFSLGLLGACTQELPGISGVDPVPSDPVPPDHGSWLSMDTSPNGQTPVIAYYDREFNGLGFAIGTLDAEGAVSWYHERVDGYQDASGLNTGDIGTYTSMKVAPDGTVWIASHDKTRNQLKFARRLSGNLKQGQPREWINGVIDAGPGVGTWSSMALSQDGRPMVTYHDEINGHLKFAILTENPGFSDNPDQYGWAISTIYEGAPFAFPDPESGEDVVRAGDAGEHTRIVRFGSTLYVAFHDKAEGSLRLAESPDEGASWNVSRVAPATPDGVRNVGAWPSILVDGDELIIAYHDVGNQDLLVSTRDASNSWSTQVVDAGEFVGADSEIFRRAGSLNIVYFDGQTNDMRLAVRTGSTWTRSILGGQDSAVGFHNEVVRIGEDWFAASYDFGPRAVFWTPLRRD